MTVSDETLTLRKSMNMRASLESFAFSHSKTAISFNILLILMILYLRNMYIFRSQITICMIHISPIQFPVITYGTALYIQTTVYRQKTDIEKIYEYASERGASERAWIFFFFPLSHSKTAISFNILLVLLILYLRNCRNIYIFRSQITICMIHYTCIINAVPCYYLWYGVILTKHWRWENLWICERARSERAWTFLHFHNLKLLFPSIFCWYTSDTLSQKHIYFRSVRLKLQSAWYIYHQCSSLFLCMVWRYIYKRKYTNKTLTLKKNYVYASERSERD